MSNTPNLEMWDVTQAHYEEDDMCISGSNMRGIATNGYQNLGEPIDQNIFFCQLDNKRTENPLTLTFWNFACSMVSAQMILDPSIRDIAGCFSDITAKSTSSRLVGYAYGGQSSGTLTYMEPAPQGSGVSPSQALTNTFGKLQNIERWYPNQDTQHYNDTFSGMYPFLRMNVTKICGVIMVDVSRGYEDCTAFNTSGDGWYAWSYYTYTLEDWVAHYQSVYPEILRCYIQWYIGANDNRTLTDISVFTDYNYYCDDLCLAWEGTIAPPIFAWTSEDMPKLNSDIEPHGYMFQTMLFEGFRCIHTGANTIENITGITRGIFQYGTVRRSIYKSNGVWLPAAVCWYAGTVEQLREAARKFRLPIAPTVEKAMYGNVTTDPDIELPRSNPDGTYKDYTTDPDEKAEEIADGLKKEDFEPENLDPEITEGDPDDPSNEDYDPDKDPEKDNEVKDIPLNEPSLGTVGVFNRCYACNANELQDLADFLWNVDEPTYELILKGLRMMGQNPFNAIISIFMYPFEVANTGNLEDIRIGTVDTEVSGLPIDYTSVRVFDLGTCYFWAQYKNYLDYEPYTTAELYIPYVGVLQISVKEFLKKHITVKMVVDLLTGVGQVVVYAKPNEPNANGDGIPVIYRNCTVGAQISVTGQDSSLIAGNYIKAMSEIMKGAGSLASGANTSGISNIAQGSIDLYTAQHVPIESSGSNSPQCGFYMPQNCYLIVNRPKPVDIPNYGHLVGYACYDSGVVRNFGGYAQFTNVILNITVATDDEKKEILTLLENGVFV